MITIRKYSDPDYSAVMGIVKELGEWFDENARHKSIPIDLRHQENYIAICEKNIIGFITLYVAEGKLQIGWMGVRKSYHRRGVGRALLSIAEEVARKKGINELATYTLGDKVDYKPYEQTRKFYIKNGFCVYQRNQTDNPSCPEEIRISKIVED